MSEVGLQMLDRARRDAGVFAEVLLGQPLWPHQLEVVASSARYRTICAGRQVGKSRLLAVLALHQAYAVAGSTTLLVSAGDTASKRLLEEVASLALASPILAGSVIDESSQLVTLSNGSSVRAVPASQRQIRGWPVDLLILDEAAFLDPEIWRSAEPTIIARPGSRIVLSSSPWGAPDHFFRVLWGQGMGESAGELYASWHWPSTTSPMVDAVLLEQIRERETPAYFAREYLAEWTDAAGAYFSSAEIEAATGDLGTVDPEGDDLAALGSVVGGVDFGMARDAHALCVIAALPKVDDRGRTRYRVAYVEERFGLSYELWIERLAELAGVFSFLQVSAETNGVGQMAAQVLARRLWEVTERDVVAPVTTTLRSKENAFGFIKLLMQSGRLVLPRHPSLLRQLAALEFAMTESGAMRISVPERAGHDDVAMSLALAVEPLMSAELVPVEPDRIVTAADMFPDEEMFRDDWAGYDGMGRLQPGRDAFGGRW